MSSDILLAAILRARGIAVFERLPNQAYHPVVEPPPWLLSVFEQGAPGTSATLVGALPFLDDFLVMAEEAWKRGGGEPAESGPFAVDGEGEDLLLRASACTIEGRMLLLVERLTGDADTRPILRTARERMLDSETLARQIAALHAPAAEIDREVAYLASTAHGSQPAPQWQATIERLRRGNDQLRQILAGLPKPPETRRGKNR